MCLACGPMFLLLLTSSSLYITLTTAAIVGEPSIRCEKDQVLVSISTDKPFKGHIFIQGQFGKQKCRRDYRKLSESLIKTNFSFNNCGMRIKRQTNPPGLVITSTLVLACHPTFITANDKAFNNSHIQLIINNYSSLDAKTVLMQPPMPVCKYSVLDKVPDGEPVISLKLGDMTYHQWDCGKEHHNIYCMRLYSCTADNGQGKSQQIIDSDGWECSVDESIFPQIKYTSDMSAEVAVKAFKFADHSKIFFQCQIGLSLKANYGSGKCERPTCAIRRRRSLRIAEEVYDLFSQQLSIDEIHVSRRHDQHIQTNGKSPPLF
uniref:ZP domain-containing protein n=1 Tax=Syphacia muris TaxID=451379 RepID=A0A0N5AME4_9BILA